MAKNVVTGKNWSRQCNPLQPVSRVMTADKNYTDFKLKVIYAVFQNIKIFVYNFFKLAWANKRRERWTEWGSMKIMGMGRRRVMGEEKEEMKEGEEDGREKGELRAWGT